MSGTDATSHDEGADSGLSPTTWAVILTFVGVVVGYLLAEQAWVTPDWDRWWLRILAVEVVVYALTLFVPPIGRLSLSHGFLRILVGMAMRVVMVAVNALLRMSGGEAGFLESAKVFWAGNWPAALGEIACVAIGVYWFRYLAVQRLLRATALKEAPGAAAPGPAKRPREELIDALVGQAEDAGAKAAVAVEERPIPKPPAPVEPVAAVAPPETSPPPGPRLPIAPERLPLLAEPTEPELPAAEPEVEVAPEVAVEVVKLPAETVLRALPATMLAEPPDDLAQQMAGTELSFAWDDILPQLERGEVRADSLAVLSQIPRDILAAPANRLAGQLPEGVVLPLEEIVMRAPAEVFAPPADQDPGVQLPSGPPIFHETAVADAPPAMEFPTPEPALRETEPVTPVKLETEEEEELELASVEQPSVAIEEAETEIEEPALEVEEAPAPEVAILESPIEQAPPPTMEAAAVLADEPIVTEPAPVEAAPPLEETAEPAPVVSAAEPPVEPAPPVAAQEPAELEADLEREILTALKGAGSTRVELIARDGLTVVVADGEQRLAGGFELTKSVLALASASDSGDLSFALVTGTGGATFVGGVTDSPGVYLVVMSEGASAGQVSVAARKAVGSLARLGLAQAPPAFETAPAADDPWLTMPAGASAEAAAGGYRAPSGLSVVVCGLSGRVAALTATAAAEAWQAAGVAQPGGPEKLLLMGARRTVGVARGAEAGALVAAGFDSGMNPGLAGTALTKLARSCQPAGRGGA